MDFWAAEVKSGQRLSVELMDTKILRLSNASLGDITNNTEEIVSLYMTIADKVYPLGTLNSSSSPQLELKFFIEEDFTLSHDWSNGSVFFHGNDADNLKEDPDTEEVVAKCTPELEEDTKAVLEYAISSVHHGKKRLRTPTDESPDTKKKPKLIAPDGKKLEGHVVKTPENKSNQKAAPSSAAGTYHCESCTRNFKTDDALQSHNKAKHPYK